MTHSFDTRIAELLGIEKAIILQNISHWMKKNKANKTHEKNGNTYTYNSYDAFQELFPYMKINTIKRVIRELEDADILTSRNDLNTTRYDKTKWYSILKNNEVYKLLFDSYKNNHQQLEIPPSTITDDKTYTSEKDFSLSKKQSIDNVAGEYIAQLEQWVTKYAMGLHNRRIKDGSTLGEPMDFAAFSLQLRAGGYKYKNFASAYRVWIQSDVKRRT